MTKSDIDIIVSNYVIYDKWGIELHFYKHGIRSNFERLFIQLASTSMANKGTPKKLYKKPSGSTVTSRCRLCNTVADPQHSKNLFRDSNRAIVRNAETLYGGELLQTGDLPHLVCRPCERRLNTALQFKRTTRKLREDFRAKRCVELLPSVIKPAPKVRAAGSSHRRSIDFNIAADESESPTLLSSHVCICLYYFVSFQLVVIFIYFSRGIFSAINESYYYE